MKRWQKEDLPAARLQIKTRKQDNDSDSWKTGKRGVAKTQDWAPRNGSRKIYQNDHRSERGNEMLITISGRWGQGRLRYRS